LAKKKRYYAVVKGRNPGIYTEWKGHNGAQAQIMRFSGSVYKGFETEGEAKKFMKQPINEQPDIQETEIKGLKEGEIIIYTDGACINNPGPGGYGVVIKNGKKTEELSGGYRMTKPLEIPSTTYFESLKRITDEDGFFSAFSPTIQAINPDLWEQLLELCGKHDVRFQWVRGHAGNKGNERCDELATKAALGSTLLKDDVYEGNNN